jgi:hypothetical protein
MISFATSATIIDHEQRSNGNDSSDLVKSPGTSASEDNLNQKNMKKTAISRCVSVLIQAAANRAKLLCVMAAAVALGLFALPNQASALGQQLINPNFTTGDFTGWLTFAAEGWAVQVATNGVVGVDGQAVKTNPDVATNSNYSFYTIGDYQNTGYDADGMYQDIPASVGDVYTASGYGFSYANDYFAGLPNNGDPANPVGQAWIEVTFRDATKNNILALYRSAVVWASNTWVYLPVTNQYDPVALDVTNTVTELVAPPGTGDVRYQVTFQQRDYSGGTAEWDEFSLDWVSGPVPPTLSAITPSSHITQCTNTILSCTAAAPSGNTISSVSVITSTSVLGGATATVTTNTYTTNNQIVSGIGGITATINFPLTTNIIYHYAEVEVVTDSGGVGIGASDEFDTLTPALVIEASDFNYSGGNFINTPANGGLSLYAGLVGNASIDENKNPANGSQSDKSNYRPNDAVIIANANPNTMTEQKFVTAFADGTTNYSEQEVGYNGVGDWLDYTRTYGSGGSAPAGTYDVWLYMTTDGGGVQAALSEVTSSPTQENQTTVALGNFGTSSFSESDSTWAAYEYVPLEDQFGNLVSVTLNGQQTLRSTIVGNPNLAFYMLVAATPTLTPALLNRYPDGLELLEETNYFTFTVGPANGASIASSGIHLVLNGVDVTGNSGFSLTQAGNDWTGNYPLASNSVYTAVINVTNTGSLSSSFTNQFDTFSSNSFQWEAVDYDFSTNNGAVWISGLFIDHPVPTCDTTTSQTGELASNSYFAYPTGFTPGVDPQSDGAVAQQGIDINFPDTQPIGNNYYRADGVGSQPSGDLLRPQFVAARAEFSDPNIGPMQIGYFNQYNWLNYTRHYPTNTFNVWARLAGGGGPFSGTTLSMVTSGGGTATQTTNVLGTFSDPNAAGWETFHWIPLLDSNSNKVVVSLDGLATLKVTSGNNLNMGFFLLAPALPPFTLAGSVVDGSLDLSFPTAIGHSYQVLFTSSLASPNWTPVGPSITGDGSVHVLTESLSGKQGFYTVSQQ